MSTADIAPPTDLVEQVRDTPVVVFTDPDKFDEFFEVIRKKALSVGTDVSKDAARKRIISMARTVTSTKTAIDSARKALNDDHHKEIKRVNEAGKRMTEMLAELAEEVRRPVTAWEAQEKARIDSAKAIIQSVVDAGYAKPEETAAEIAVRIDRLKKTDVSAGALGEFAEQAGAKLEASLNYLALAHDRARMAEEERARAERERAELEKLRREMAERDERDRREAEERARQERAAAEANARAEREARLAQEAEERAARAAEEARLEEKRRAEAALREAEERADRERREADARAEAERRRLIQEQEEREERRLAEERRQREEEARRAADREHRNAITAKAASDIAAAGGIGEERARKIVDAIAGGAVARISIKF